MQKVNPADYHFSATIRTSRREVLYALRALSMAAQRTGNNKKPWSGVTDASWSRRRGLATFRFSSTAFRKQFLDWAAEIIIKDWTFIGDSDDDPLENIADDEE